MDKPTSIDPATMRRVAREQMQARVAHVPPDDTSDDDDTAYWDAVRKAAKEKP